MIVYELLLKVFLGNRWLQVRLPILWEDLELGPDVLSKACRSYNLLILRALGMLPGEHALLDRLKARPSFIWSRSGYPSSSSTTPSGQQRQAQ